MGSRVRPLATPLSLWSPWPTGGGEEQETREGQREGQFWKDCFVRHLFAEVYITRKQKDTGRSARFEGRV